MKIKTMLMVVSLAAISLFAGCEKKGPVQKAGEQIDKAVDKTQHKAEDVGKDIKKSIDK